MTNSRYVLLLLRLFFYTLTTQSMVVIIDTKCSNIKNYATECIDVFRIILTINTNYLPKQH
jgi:hypothetical protein